MLITSDTGTYIVFEGVDFCGKTTLAQNVHAALLNANKTSILTKHPGATSLGKHLRKLVKNPEIIDTTIRIDALSAQTLMMVDQICFINTILTPQLDAGHIVLADRCNFISCIAYGLPEGLNIETINKLFQLAQSPCPDKVFILKAPWTVVAERMVLRGRSKDRFEDRGGAYLRAVAEIYDTLSIRPDLLSLLSDFVPLDRIEYLDATKTPAALAKEVTAAISNIASEKMA